MTGVQIPPSPPRIHSIDQKPLVGGKSRCVLDGDESGSNAIWVSLVELAAEAGLTQPHIKCQ